MALAIDGSTPAAATTGAATKTVTSPAFSPPANSLLVAFIACDDQASGTETISSVTDNLGTHLSWAQSALSNDNDGSGNFLQGLCAIYEAFTTSAQTNMAVSATTNENNNTGMYLQVLVFTGAKSSQTGAATAHTSNKANTGTPSLAVTTTASNSWVWGIVQNWTNATAPTAGASQTVYSSDLPTGNGFWTQQQNATTPSSGTNVTINDTAPTNISFNMCVVEILAATVAPTLTWTPEIYRPVRLPQPSVPTARRHSATAIYVAPKTIPQPSLAKPRKVIRAPRPVTLFSPPVVVAPGPPPVFHPQTITSSYALRYRMRTYPKIRYGAMFRIFQPVTPIFVPSGPVFTVESNPLVSTTPTRSLTFVTQGDSLVQKVVTRPFVFIVPKENPNV